MKKIGITSIFQRMALVAIFSVFGLLIASHFFVTAETFAYENFLRDSHLYYFRFSFICIDSNSFILVV